MGCTLGCSMGCSLSKGIEKDVIEEVKVVKVARLPAVVQTVDSYDDYFEFPLNDTFEFFQPVPRTLSKSESMDSAFTDGNAEPSVTKQEKDDKDKRMAAKLEAEILRTRHSFDDRIKPKIVDVRDLENSPSSSRKQRLSAVELRFRRQLEQEKLSKEEQIRQQRLEKQRRIFEDVGAHRYAGSMDEDGFSNNFNKFTRIRARSCGANTSPNDSFSDSRYSTPLASPNKSIFSAESRNVGDAIDEITNDNENDGFFALVTIDTDGHI